MNFIIEFLPKKSNSLEFVCVVRRPDGFPLCVCDSLDEAKLFIEEKLDEAVKAKSNA